tara:strand:+ start:12334 stop:13095 length:762 start_codon:yes stop_codon:yes gene_type:complete
MANIRLIPRLDIKGPNLIKGIHLEGLRVVGDPQVYAVNYYESGADELLYMDIVASLYGRNNLSDIVKSAAENVFIPITVGGGIRSVADADQLLRSGADKVAINTAAINDPELISKLSQRFGSQCVVVSIEAKKQSGGKWECYVDNGRERTGIDVVNWVREAITLGAGELLITSVDKEGTRKGFDLELYKAVKDVATIPLIACGGMGCLEDFDNVVKDGGVDAVSMADVLHYNRLTLPQIRSAALDSNINVRQP